MKARDALKLIFAEFHNATERYGPFHSAHEGFAVIKEEVDELWTEVKRKQGSRRLGCLKKEGIQVAAMALRFLVDCVDEDPKPAEVVPSKCVHGRLLRGERMPAFAGAVSTCFCCKNGFGHFGSPSFMPGSPKFCHTCSRDGDTLR